MAIPKEAVDAAFPQTVVVGKTIIRPFTLQHVLALAKMRHPLMSPNPSAMGLEDQLMAVAVMGMDPEQLADVLASERGPDVIRKLAYKAAGNIPLEDVSKLVTALQEQLEKGFSTFVPMRRDGDGAEVPLRVGSTTGGGPSSRPTS